MYCMHCGKEIPDAAHYCMFCGKEQSTRQKKTKRRAEVKRKQISVQEAPRLNDAMSEGLTRRLRTNAMLRLLIGAIQIVGSVTIIINCLSFYPDGWVRLHNENRLIYRIYVNVSEWPPEAQIYYVLYFIWIITGICNVAKSVWRKMEITTICTHPERTLQLFDSGSAPWILMVLAHFLFGGFVGIVVPSHDRMVRKYVEKNRDALSTGGQHGDEEVSIGLHTPQTILTDGLRKTSTN